MKQGPIPTLNFVERTNSMCNDILLTKAVCRSGSFFSGATQGCQAKRGKSFVIAKRDPILLKPKQYQIDVHYE